MWEFLYKNLVSEVRQGSVLGPILFDFFINDLFLFIKLATLHNYADDNVMHVHNVPKLCSSSSEFGERKQMLL